MRPGPRSPVPGATPGSDIPAPQTVPQEQIEERAAASRRAGRITPCTLDPVTIEDPADPVPEVFNVSPGQAREVWSTPFGDMGTVVSGQGIEMAWVGTLAEPIDQNWFSSDRVDLILVVQGQLKFEFESPGQSDRVLSAGEVLVLPAGQRCRAYRWPRDRREATVFVAAYPTGQSPDGHRAG